MISRFLVILQKDNGFIFKLPLEIIGRLTHVCGSTIGKCRSDMLPKWVMVKDFMKKIFITKFGTGGTGGVPSGDDTVHIKLVFPKDVSIAKCSFLGDFEGNGMFTWSFSMLGNDMPDFWEERGVSRKWLVVLDVGRGYEIFDATREGRRAARERRNTDVRT